MLGFPLTNMGFPFRDNMGFYNMGFPLRGTTGFYAKVPFKGY